MKRITSILVTVSTLFVAACASPDEETPRNESTLPGIPGLPTTNGAPLTDPAAMPAGPCAFDTHAVVLEGSRVVHTVTAAGRHFAFESNGAAWSSNGMDLTEVPHFAAGPCAGQAKGACKLDTRAFLLVAGRRVESITAYGKLYHFEGTRPGETNGQDLSAVARFANGPCKDKAPGTCTLDTRVFVTVGNVIVESITAYGKMFAFDAAGKAAADNGLGLTSVARYAAGPCKDKAPGTCTFDTRAFTVEDGSVVEVVTAGGMVWRWQVAGPAAGSEVQPSGVPSSTVAPWKTAICP